jgi:2-polyprenyl-3-methyl-5-hydroxy-6-metoxy-1,4-benzoquinol methylase
MSTKRYGKPSLPLLLQKTSFFENNDQLVKKQKEIALIYKKQPKRKKCKNCDTKLGIAPDFNKDGIDYIICNYCQHLNGMYEDTKEFCEGLYTADSGEEYAKTYYNVDNLDNYNYRTANIYIPKAEFLYTSLFENKINPNSLEYFDFGAGSGYFIAALKKIGLNKISGTDVSKSQVDFGNAMMGEKLLQIHDMQDTTSILQKCTAQVVSMIGVLEHIQNPREVLSALKHNNNMKFLFILVPTFSLTVFLEIISPAIFHRQLHDGHTHLYTKKSLLHLCREFGFEVMSEWWFGTDVVDLFRHISVTLQKQKCSKKLIEIWRQEFIPLLDAMQLEIDKKHYSSEVHMVLKKI